MATRSEQAKRMTKIRTKRTKTNISKCVNGMFSFDYKRKMGTGIYQKLLKIVEQVEIQFTNI